VLEFGQNLQNLKSKADPSRHRIRIRIRIRVFVFVFVDFGTVYKGQRTDQRATANDLCRMNGRQRIKPFPKFFTGNPSGDDDVDWTEDSWLIPLLSVIIFEQFPIIKSADQYLTEDGHANFVTSGTLPAVALEEAARIEQLLLQRDTIQPFAVDVDDFDIGFFS
jgi:hypothetical protein